MAAITSITDVGRKDRSSLCCTQRDVTLSTFLKLAQALDLEFVPVPREDAAKFESFLNTKRETISSTKPPSLLERYQVKDDEAQSNG